MTLPVCQTPNMKNLAESKWGGAFLTYSLTPPCPLVISVTFRIFFFFQTGSHPTGLPLWNLLSAVLLLQSPESYRHEAPASVSVLLWYPGVVCLSHLKLRVETVGSVRAEQQLWPKMTTGRTGVCYHRPLLLLRKEVNVFTHSDLCIYHIQHALPCRLFGEH